MKFNFKNLFLLFFFALPLSFLSACSSVDKEAVELVRNAQDTYHDFIRGRQSVVIGTSLEENPYFIDYTWTTPKSDEGRIVQFSSALAVAEDELAYFMPPKAKAAYDKLGKDKAIPAKKMKFIVQYIIDAENKVKPLKVGYEKNGEITWLKNIKTLGPSYKKTLSTEFVDVMFLVLESL